eukprot:521046-Prymnesium_polylepis.1
MRAHRRRRTCRSAAGSAPGCSAQSRCCGRVGPPPPSRRSSASPPVCGAARRRTAPHTDGALSGALGRARSGALGRVWAFWARFGRVWAFGRFGRARVRLGALGCARVR